MVFRHFPELTAALETAVKNEQLTQEQVQELEAALKSRRGKTLHWDRKPYLGVQAILENTLGEHIATLQNPGSNIARFTYATPAPMTPIRQLNNAEGFLQTHGQVPSENAGPMGLRETIIYENLVNRNIPTRLLIDQNGFEEFIRTAEKDTKSRSTVLTALTNIEMVLEQATYSTWGVETEGNFSHSCAILTLPGRIVLKFTGPQADRAHGEKMRIITGPEAREELETIHTKHHRAQEEGRGNGYLKTLLEQFRARVEAIDF